MAKENWPDWDVYTRDACKCVYCGLDGRSGFEVWQQLDIDHLIPKAQGGTNGPANKVVVCLRCNLMKGSYDPRGYESTAPKFVEPPSEEARKILIATASEYIKRNETVLQSDFRLMLKEISEANSAA